MPSIKFPIEVTGIIFEKKKFHEPKPLFGGECGDMVAVRPCAEEFEDKTFLGVLLGEFPLSQSVSLNKETGELTVSRAMYNPAIFIPERNAIVYGAGSWWGKVKSKDQLRQITDDDIQNVWYVKALKQLEAEAASDAE